MIIPGVTDHEEDLLKLKTFLSSLKTVEKVELLPYHNLGEYKWKELGLPYKLNGVRPATNEDIQRASKILDCKVTC